MRRITSWDFFLGVSNKSHPASSLFLLLERIYLQRWFSSSKGFGKTAQRPPRLCYSTPVTPICIRDNICLLFISKNEMEMTTRKQTSCCHSSNFQHLLPSRDSIFKICSVFRFWWGCQKLTGAATGVLTLLSPAFPAPPSSPLSPCSTSKHAHTAPGTVLTPKEPRYFYISCNHSFTHPALLTASFTQSKVTVASVMPQNNRDRKARHPYPSSWIIAISLMSCSDVGWPVTNKAVSTGNSRKKKEADSSTEKA